ncbi:MAG: alpha-amylase family glycosyl hydrolase [Candidatus Alcyoniella australis]|nr:alpha-amylase family glycosyl hydrolase [Candidatus Alcyoniella australis]
MEIFVRSYVDSDGDGIGDLAGLTSKLSHIADLGIGAIWLMPIYPTPFVDSGYDVAQYCSINPDYGTLADFDALLARAHELGIRVFLDGVFNHTSDQLLPAGHARPELRQPRGAAGGARPVFAGPVPGAAA